MSMRVLEWGDFTGPGSPALGETAMTIGVFDGIHRGHQALMERILRSGLLPVVITFRHNPKKVLKPHSYHGDILSIDRKLRLFEQMGVGITVMIDFSEKFSRLDGKGFIDLLKDRGNLRYLVIGSNFRCGYRLDTAAALIKEMNEARGIPTEVVESVLSEGKPVSSSRIRAAIAAGCLVEAAALLGRRVEIDLSGLSAAPGPGGVCFDLASRKQIAPPFGRYPVLLFEINSPEGIKTEISVGPQGVLIPCPFNAERIEFLSGSQ
jgi:riboflavin kinase/FMN adenylyltransferase